MSNTDKAAFTREVIKSGHLHLVSYYQQGKLCGQLQLPATSATKQVMVIVDDQGYMELFGICGDESLLPQQQYHNLIQANTQLGYDNQFIGYGTLSHTTDNEELFILLNNVPILSLSVHDLCDQYAGNAKAVVPDPQRPTRPLYYAYLVKQYRHLGNIDITQIVSDLVVRYMKYIPSAMPLVAAH